MLRRLVAALPLACAFACPLAACTGPELATMARVLADLDVASPGPGPVGPGAAGPPSPRGAEPGMPAPWAGNGYTGRVVRGEPIDRAMARLNAARAAAGLAPYRFDAAASRAAELHATYLVVNRDHPSTEGLGAHDEDPALPGYTEEGRRAGGGNIHFAVTPEVAIDGWLGSFYHRGALLVPGTCTVALGAAVAEREPEMDYRTVILPDACDDRPDVYLPPVAYPGDGQADVPLGMYREVPDPLEGQPLGGYPVTLYYGGDADVTLVSATLTDASGAAVPCHVWSPDRPALPGWRQAGEVALVAKDDLAPSTRYTVDVTVRLGDGRVDTRRWSFTTEAGQDGEEELDVTDADFVDTSDDAEGGDG